MPSCFASVLGCKLLAYDGTQGRLVCDASFLRARTLKFLDVSKKVCLPRVCVSVTGCQSMCRQDKKAKAWGSCSTLLLKLQIPGLNPRIVLSQSSMTLR